MLNIDTKRPRPTTRRRTRRALLSVVAGAALVSAMGLSTAPAHALDPSGASEGAVEPISSASLHPDQWDRCVITHGTGPMTVPDGCPPMLPIDPVPLPIPCQRVIDARICVPPYGDRPVVVEPEPGVGENVRARPFDRAQVSADGREVRVYYTSGPRNCYVLDRVEAKVTQPDQVVVTLYEGARPGSEFCIQLAVPYVTVVKLDQPVHPKATVIDGSIVLPDDEFQGCDPYVDEDGTVVNC